MQVEDTFTDQVLDLSYDNAGCVTDDGVYLYEYDARGRLSGVRRDGLNSSSEA